MIIRSGRIISEMSDYIIRILQGFMAKKFKIILIIMNCEYTADSPVFRFQKPSVDELGGGSRDGGNRRQALR